MEQNKEYFVFISYSSLDNEWAIWLRHELEHYHLPASFNGRTDVRDNLRKVFRDRDELSAGPEWDEQVQKALEETNNLIVICSPHSAKSEAVNKEVETFIALGKEDHIFPFIVEGDKPEVCFPKALRRSKLGGDVNKDGGRDSAFIKVVAGMLKVSFPSLWNRYEIEKAEEERKIREQRDKLLIMQSRFLAEKGRSLVTEGDSYTARLLALFILPKRLDNPDRPYVVEAEELLREALKHEDAILRGHTSCVTSVAVSPKDKYIVSGSYDNTIRIWDFATGRQIGESIVEHYGIVRSVAFSPDGNRVVSGSDDRTIRIWDVASCKQIGEPLEGHTAEVLSVAFSRDGKFIVSGSRDKAIRIWDVATCKQIGEPLEGHTAEVLSVTFSPDGKRVVSGSWDHTIRIWDVATGKQIGEPLEGHTSGVTSVAVTFRRDGKRIVSGSWDNTIRIWDVVTGKQIGEPLVGHTAGVLSVALSRYEDRIASGSQDGSIRIWDFVTGKQIEKPLIGHTNSVCSVAFSRILDNIVSGSPDHTIRIWDIDTDRKIELLLVDSSEYNASRTKDDSPLQELIGETSWRFKDRHFTLEERKKYYLD